MIFSCSLFQTRPNEYFISTLNYVSKLYDLINEMFVQYVCTIKNLRNYIMKYLFFIYQNKQFMIRIHCKTIHMSIFIKSEPNQPFERIQRLNYWRVFDIWIIVVQEIGGFFDPYSLLFNHTWFFVDRSRKNIDKYLLCCPVFIHILVRIFLSM